MMVEWNPERQGRLEMMKGKLQLSDNEFVWDRTVYTDPGILPETLTKSVREKLLTGSAPKEEQPIHYAQISGTDLDYTMLMKQLRVLLKQVRYLVFEYTWKGDWRDHHDNPKLSNVIQTLKENGLVCYWAGDKDSDFALWRITNCWQDYFDYKTWAHIACVNTLHDDVKGLAMNMERKFLETLQRKDLSF